MTVLFGLFRHLKSYQPLALKLSALALIGLMIAAPLLKPEMLCGDDFQWHLSNAIELDRLIGDGVWYPRWSPDVAFGYGLPNFDFYSPLPRYLSVVIHRLGMPMREATKMPAVLALMLAGPAMYLLARSLYGERAGMVAGLAYACAPYLADDALQRFALNEALAMSLAPLVLWAFGRLGLHLPRASWGRIIVAAIAFALLVLAHNLMALMFAPLLAGYLLLIWWNSQQRAALIGRVALAGLFALGLTAFFWLPFLAEVGWVQMWRATVWEATGEPMYPLHFKTLADILVPVTLWPDYRVENPLLQRMLSLPQVVLAGAGFALAWRLPSRLKRGVAILFSLALAACILMMTRASRPLWDNVTPLHIIQFPWRFLAPASLAAALLTGIAVSNLEFQTLNRKATVIVLDALLLVVLSAWTLPWVRPFTCPIEANPSSWFLVWADRKTAGGGSTGEHLPVWVEAPPGGSPLEADLLADRPVDRLDRRRLPAGAQAELRSSRLLESQWEITSSRTLTASFYNYYYPGWSVRVDGESVPIAPTPRTGLIEAAIPAGRHVISLHLDSTPAQTTGNLVSLGAALAIFGLLLTARLNTPCPTTNDTPVDSARVSAWQWATLAVIGAVVFGIRLVLAGFAPPAVPAGPAMPPNVARTSIDLGKVQLIGYELSAPTVRASEPLTVTLYWQTSSFLLTSYKSFVHVTDANGNLIAQSDAVPRNWTYATTGWLPGEWIGDPHVLSVPTNSQGPWQIWAGMYDAETLERLTPSPGEGGRVKLGVLH